MSTPIVDARSQNVNIMETLPEFGNRANDLYLLTNRSRQCTNYFSSYFFCPSPATKFL